MATPTTWQQALRQHDLTGIRLATPHNTGLTSRTSDDLVLNICDGETATLRKAVAHLASRFQIVAIVPPFNTSIDAQQLGYSAALLAKELGLPGFSTSAFPITINRYLSRCHWQRAHLPVSPFSLIQFSSALLPAALSIGLPIRLSPIHYQLRHLGTHIQRETDAPKAYHLISSTLQRHHLAHPTSLIENGEDPRTHHHIRFSWMSDMLASAEIPAVPVETTVIIHNHAPQVVTCTPMAQRYRKRPHKLRRNDIVALTELSIEACKALHIQNAVVTCVLQYGEKGSLLDGIIPNHVDTRLIPAIEATYHCSWPEIILKTVMQTA